MNDLISRQDAIEAIRKLPNAGIHWFVSAEAVFDALLKLPSVQPEQRWIPCSERLPEYGKTALWCNDEGSIFTTAITYMNGTSWAVGKRHRRCQVVAWMPMPEPFELQESEDKE